MVALRTRRQQAPGARFIDPKVLSRIKDLEFVARTVVDGFISGLHRSPFLGLSIDFAEHRAYMPGDDIRRIDWRLYARTDRYYVKEYEADTNANFVTVLDISRSMDYGSQGMTKLDYAKFLSASLTYLSTKQRDRVGLITFGDDIVDVVPASAKHFDTCLHTLDRLHSVARGEFTGPIRKVAETLNRRSIIAFISDLYEDPEVVVESLNGLRYRGHDIAVFHILDPAEIVFGFDESGSYEDLETGEKLSVIPDQLRTAYQQRINEHCQTLSKRLGENRIDYSFHDISKPLDQALFSYLSDRQRMSRVR